MPFLYTSGASFVEVYVGQGAKRVRQFFEDARAQAPSAGEWQSLQEQFLESF